MKLKYIFTERIYDSYIDLLHYEFNSLTDEISESLPISIVLINDILVRTWIANTYFFTHTETIYKDLYLAFAKESHIIDKQVIGIGCNDFFKFYFIGMKEYKTLLKKEVDFELFYWIMRLDSETTYSENYTDILLSTSDMLKKVSLSDQNIGPTTILKRKGKGYILKDLDLDTLITELRTQKSHPKTHT